MSAPISSPGLLAIVEAAQLRHDSRALSMPRFDFETALAGSRLHGPGAKRHDVVARVGVGVNLDPTLDAEQAANAAERHGFVSLCAHCGIAARAGDYAATAVPAVLLQKIGHAFRRLRALRDPVVDARHVEAESLLAARWRSG